LAMMAGMVVWMLYRRAGIEHPSPYDRHHRRDPATSHQTV
jgi:hypothetical protein